MGGRIAGTHALMCHRCLPCLVADHGTAAGLGAVPGAELMRPPRPTTVVTRTECARPSGRWRPWPRRTAPATFNSKPEAGDWLTVQETAIVRGEWTDPDRGKEAFGPYAERWFAQRPNLKAAFSNVHLVDITPAIVRQWRHDLLVDKHTPSCSPRCADRSHRGISATMVAKAYRLLRAVLMTAVDDELNSAIRAVSLAPAPSGRASGLC